MSEAPRLSVIMTVYNGEDFLTETLDAVWAQTFTDFELVVVNNGSTDGTQAILDDVDDDRMRVIHQTKQNATFGDGIRLAYKHARGQFIAVQDADDVSMPERFAKQVAAFDLDANLGLVIGAFQDMDKDGNLADVHCPPTERQALINAFQTHNPMAHSTYMYRREASDQVGGYPLEYAYGPDFGLAIRLIKNGWGVKVLNDVVLRLRLHAGQTSMLPTVGVTRAHDALYLFLEAAGLDSISPMARRMGGRHIAKCTVQYALALLGDGFGREGLKQLFFGLLRHPLYSLVYLGYRLSLRLGLMKPVGQHSNQS